MRNNYPHFILFTSTPNGVIGDGKFFHDIWANAIDSDEIFNEDETFVDNLNSVINSPDKNSFVKIKYHWSEDDDKDQDWYIEQKRDLNFNTRSINQELDLIFIGSSSCIFDDEFLSKLSASKPYHTKPLSHFCKLHLYSRLNPNDYYLMGVDTAKSLIVSDFA